ncbi:MAG: glycoside hydrolase family 16 protein [Bacteroidales bacterium]|nr:glycoside hydrolase family 16 protein [Bacteroidales bacterium]
MKKHFILTVLAGLFMFPAFAQPPDEDRGINPGIGTQQSYRPEHPLVDKHWELVWNDEFSNLNNWYSYDHVHNIDNDICVLLTKNVSVNNGNLVIQAERENYIFNGKLYKYTSGSVTNYNSGMRFGYIEARIKLPYGKGLWPAFWTYQYATNPSNEAEIDIFEMLGHLPPNTMTTNLHTCYRKYNPNCIENYYKEIVLPYNYTDWLTYAIEWTPTKFIWYVNGVAVRNFPNPEIVDSVRIILGMGMEYDAHYQPDSTTPFPVQMLVDYVKVYKLKCGNEVINFSMYNFDNYDNNTVKKSITIGGNGASNTIANGKNVVMRAQEFIEIKGEFTVSLGASLYLDADFCEDSGGMYD